MPATNESTLADRRDQIVAVAARLFVANGYEATTMQHIADDLGLLKGSVYYHIAAKEDLLWELCRRHLPVGGGRKAARLEPLERLREIARGSVLGHIHDTVGALAAVRNYRSLSDERREVYLKARRALLRQIRKAVVDGQGDGVVCPHLQPAFATQCVHAIATGWPEWYADVRLPADEFADHIATAAVASVGCDHDEAQGDLASVAHVGRT